MYSAVIHVCMYSQTLFIWAVWDQVVPVTSKLPVSLNMLFITSLTTHNFYLACYNKVQIRTIHFFVNSRF